MMSLCCSLKMLQRLSLQSNRLTSMAGLAACTGLQELYLSHNGIAQLEVSTSTRGLEVPSKWCVNYVWSGNARL